MNKKLLLSLLSFISVINYAMVGAAENFETQFNRAIELFKQQQYAQAIEHFKKAISIDPSQPQSYFNLGLIYLEQQNYEQACQAFEQATKHKTDYLKAYNFLGQVYQKLEQLDKALTAYQKMIEHGSTAPDTHFALARIYRTQNKFDDAKHHYKKVLELDPNNINALFDISYIHTHQGFYEAAIPYYEKLLAINPNITDAICNFSHTLKYVGRISEARNYYQKVLAEWPEFPHAHYGFAECSLALGDFKSGWKSFEWRWKRDQNTRNYSKKLWDGSNVSGKTIMLRAEYGQGDTMQFIRYAQLLKQQGAKVILEAQHTLINLLSRCPYLDSVIPVVDTVDQLPAFDFQIPVMSLPYYFHTTLQTIPSSFPYLYADPKLVNHWKEELKTNSNFKIGICWGTSPYYEQFKSAFSKKAINLATFAPLARCPGVTLYSLQKMDGLDQLNDLPNGMVVHNFGDDFDFKHGRFMDTAAVIENIDLVVTVDTSVAHLAGALGKKVWVLLPQVADWRWMLNRKDSPWYPTMQLFRQTVSGDWDSVMDEVYKDLTQLLAERNSKKEKKTDQADTISVVAEVQVGELIDKITILQIKMERIKDPAKLINIKAELDTLLDTCNHSVPHSLKLKTLWNELLEVNSELWVIEDDIRDKERAREFDDSFVKLARSVYYTNDERCRIKRELNLLAGSRLIEEKSYTDYTIPLKK